MNLLPDQAYELVKGIRDGYKIQENLEVVVFPQSPLISRAIGWANGSSIQVGAQNCAEHKSGAYTGEISPELLKAMGCDYCLVGHSERREIFGEDNESVARKARLLTALGITPIVCIGETLEERESGAHFTKIRGQVQAIYSELDPSAYGRFVFAYEPIWAIGTGKTASPEQADEIHKFIREQIAAIANEYLAQSTSILYGGSVKASNAKDLLGKIDIDGVLVGGASLKFSEFSQIIQAYQK